MIALDEKMDNNVVYMIKNKKNFDVGAWVVYPSHGVGKIEGIDRVDINGEVLEFFVIQFPKNKLVLKLPIAKAINAGLRQVATKESLDKALDLLSKRIKRKRVMWSKRVQEYESKINSGDPIALAEVLRELHKAGGELNQSFSERQIYQLALERLAKELAVVEEIDESEAAQKVETLLQVA